MTLPKEITDIIDQLVKTDGLTKQKRSLVVQMAISMGVDKNDIYQYIDEAERAKSHTIVVGQVQEDETVLDLTQPTSPPYQPTPKASEQNATPPKESDGYTIPQKIQDLTALALQDRVLTFNEREVIVQAAIKAGVFETRINEYLDNALQERLKSYTKEDLQHCPHCGAQTPLISDKCLFCGTVLRVEGKTAAPINITGEEARIIQQENRQTDIERHNIKNCPDCGAPFPLISNVCPSCGHILHEQTGSALNIDTLIEGINSSHNKMKAVPMPNLVEMLKHYFGLIACFLWLASSNLISNEIIAGYATTAFFIAALVGLIMWRKSTFKNANDTYHEAKNDFQKYLRMVSTFYGNHTDAKNLIAQFSDTLKLYEQTYKSSQQKLALYAIIALVVLLIPFIFFN